MFKKTILTMALASAAIVPSIASANDAKELAEIREQIRHMKENYEARIQLLEKRLAETQAKQNARVAAASEIAPTATNAPTPAPLHSSTSNTFNPAVSLILGGTYGNFSRDPSQYRLQGFMSGGEIGPGARSFNLGESELSFSANVDHIYSGQLTFSLAPDNSVSVEEAFFQAKGLVNGLNIKGGRFLSSIGYMNDQHSHVWDFVDAPLAYQAFLGGQYKQDGMQAKWLTPTENFVELGAEVGNGASFPGTDRNKNGANSAAVYAHAGGDIGASSSWRAGLSYLHTNADQRTQPDGNEYAFSGRSNLWIADAIYKWSPNGNSTHTNFKLQGEYFRRNENGSLSQGDDSGAYKSAQSGWYAQGVYQFMSNWRTGLRYDRLSSGTPSIGLGSGLFPSLSPIRLREPA